MKFKNARKDLDLNSNDRLYNSSVSPFAPKNSKNVKPRGFKIFTFQAGFKKKKDDKPKKSPPKIEPKGGLFDKKNTSEVNSKKKNFNYKLKVGDGTVKNKKLVVDFKDFNDRAKKKLEIVYKRRGYDDITEADFKDFEDFRDRIPRGKSIATLIESSFTPNVVEWLKKKSINAKTAFWVANTDPNDIDKLLFSNSSRSRRRPNEKKPKKEAKKED